VKLARVLKQVVATEKHDSYVGQKLFIVKQVGLEGELMGGAIVAVDCVQAGVGDLVLLIQDGGSARLILGNSNAPIRSVIVGIVDAVELGESSWNI